MIHIREITREEFLNSITDSKEDSFAKTFKAKSDLLDLWRNTWGIVINNEVVAAINYSISKNKPKTLNLQTLHTFARHRRKGYAKRLTEFVLKKALDCDYFRVSAEETAVPFYESLGLKFQGKQKSGCSLCIVRMKDQSYSLSDDYIRSKVMSKSKGGCVEIYDEFKIVGLDKWITD